MTSSIGEYFESWRSAAANNKPFTDWLKTEALDVDHMILPAANSGDAQAQYLLALCYADGQGVPQDDAQAVAWFAKAAAQGLADAQFCLGSCYRQGRGVQRDYDRSLSYFAEAADQGYAAAQETENLARALDWYELAASWWFDEEAIRRLKLYESKQPLPADFIEVAINRYPVANLWKSRGMYDYQVILASPIGILAAEEFHRRRRVQSVPKIAEKAGEARAKGDTVEARETHASLERLQRGDENLEDLRYVRVVRADEVDVSRVGFGTLVTVINGAGEQRKFAVLGRYERYPYLNAFDPDGAEDNQVQHYHYRGDPNGSSMLGLRDKVVGDVCLLNGFAFFESRWKIIAIENALIRLALTEKAEPGGNTV